MDGTREGIPTGQAHFVRSDGGQGAGRSLLGGSCRGGVLRSVGAASSCGWQAEPTRVTRTRAVGWRCFPSRPRHRAVGFAAVGLAAAGHHADTTMKFGACSQKILLSQGNELHWTGSKFVAFDSRRATLAALPLKERLQADVEALHQKVKRAFFPLESSVTPDYWIYAKWRSVQRVFTSMLSILATQAMLEAVGVGAKRSLPAAATLNWVLKDGLGKLGKISVAAVFGRGFDTDLKAARFRSSCLYSACIFLEVLTPFFPQHFLAMATVAMVGKSIGYTTHVATQPAFNKSMSRGEHMAEISAKTQAQQTVMENVGLALVVLIRMAIKDKPRLNTALPLLLFPLLAAGDVYSISRELKSVELKTINTQRGELIAEHWVKERSIPTQGQVATRERLLPRLVPPSGSLPLTLNPIFTLASDPAQLEQLMQLYKNEKFLLGFEPVASHGHGAGDFRRRRIHMTLEEGAGANDLLLSVLQAAHLRAICKIPGAEGRPEPELLKQSLSTARRDMKLFVKGLRESGWMADTFMLSSDDREHCTYTPRRS
mmetsp:Transcript_24956/g.69595  ORF Transcript_24956/g.69595 Transcript_24956/m.69595 type:complete len:543 (-) Transcript_24956:36-1664(-)